MLQIIIKTIFEVTVTQLTANRSPVILINMFYIQLVCFKVRCQLGDVVYGAKLACVFDQVFCIIGLDDRFDDRVVVFDEITFVE